MENTTPLLVVLVSIVVVCCSNVAAARPQDFKPSRLMSSVEPGFFGASDAIFVRDSRRDGRSFDSGAVPVQQIEEFKGQIITASPPTIGSSFLAGDDYTLKVVDGSYSIGTPQGVKQEIIRYKETPELSAFSTNGKLSNSKKSSGIGKVIYGRHKERPLPPHELYIITAARHNEEPALIKRQANADTTKKYKLLKSSKLN